MSAAGKLGEGMEATSPLALPLLGILCAYEGRYEEAEDARYFREASKSESLFEAVEALSRSVRVKQVRADISEVIAAAEPRAEGLD